tara:strand:- start:1387 stop:2529 length:1143 start_codon:yes stop_codon:yes gene_type:complete
MTDDISILVRGISGFGPPCTTQEALELYPQIKGHKHSTEWVTDRFKILELYLNALFEESKEIDGIDQSESNEKEREGLEEKRKKLEEKFQRAKENYLEELRSIYENGLIKHLFSMNRLSTQTNFYVKEVKTMESVLIAQYGVIDPDKLFNRIPNIEINQRVDLVYARDPETNEYSISPKVIENRIYLLGLAKTDLEELMETSGNKGGIRARIEKYEAEMNFLGSIYEERVTLDDLFNPQYNDALRILKKKHPKIKSDLFGEAYIALREHKPISVEIKLKDPDKDNLSRILPKIYEKYGSLKGVYGKRNIPDGTPQAVVQLTLEDPNKVLELVEDGELIKDEDVLDKVGHLDKSVNIRKISKRPYEFAKFDERIDKYLSKH